jgi:hypothetical protein
VERKYKNEGINGFTKILKIMVFGVKSNEKLPQRKTFPIERVIGKIAIKAMKIKK